MNHTNAKLTLEKINRLFKSMEMDAEHISRIERDLMLSYIQQLYEIFVDTSPSQEIPSSKYSSSSRPQQEVKPDPTPREQVSYTPPRRQEPQPPPPPEEVSSPYSPPPPPPREETPPSPPPRREISSPEEPRREPPRPVYAPPPSSREENNEVDHLFEQEQAKELADKLGAAPLSDLTRAFSINDRLYFINELFGRDQQAFVDTLRHLNGLRSFEEAKQYLAREVAQKYDWTEKEKKATAKAFIKTVRRKFS